MTRTIAFAALVALAPLCAPAQQHGHGNAPYAGLQTRAIKGLSEDDIAQIRAGAGWGLALPAELNGLPGPKHLLELKEDLKLTPEQVARIGTLYEGMKAEAQAAGERFIAAEAALSDAFAAGGLSEDGLRSLIATAEAARADLRMAHLKAHLQTPAMLTEGQITRYQQLRGYANDPCTNIPEGHDPAMWKKHNGCG